MAEIALASFGLASDSNAPTAATAYTATITGGNAGVVGTAQTISLVANGTTTAVVTPSDNGGGGTFNPASIALNGQTPVTVRYTPTSAGTKTLSFTNNGGLTNQANVSDVISSTGPSPATAFTISTSPSGVLGVPQLVSFAANGTSSAIVTPTSANGTFNPSSVALNGMTAASLYFTPTAAGNTTIAVTNNGSLTNPNPAPVNVSNGRLQTGNRAVTNARINI